MKRMTKEVVLELTVPERIELFLEVWEAIAPAFKDSPISDEEAALLDGRSETILGRF